MYTLKKTKIQKKRYCLMKTIQNGKSLMDQKFVKSVKSIKSIKSKVWTVIYNPDFTDFRLLDFRLISPCYKLCSFLSDWILACYDFRAVA